MNDKLDNLILNARLTCNDRELILGYLRYESLRKLNPRQFRELWDKNIVGHKNFDDLVDELVIENHKPNWTCPHCGSDKGTWFSRVEPMGNICENCGKDVDEKE